MGLNRETFMKYCIDCYLNNTSTTRPETTIGNTRSNDIEAKLIDANYLMTTTFIFNADVVILDNPMTGVILEFFTSNKDTVYSIKYTNRLEDIRSIQVYNSLGYTSNVTQLSAYNQTLKTIGLNKEDVMTYAVAYVNDYTVPVQ